MAKVLLIGDTHNGANGNSPRLLQQNVDLYKNFIFPIIKSHNIDFCIDLGDFFDDREKVDIKVLKTVREQMLADLPVPFYFIVGNHNQYYKNNNVLNNLDGTIGDLPNVHIVDRFTQVDKIDIFPWITPNNVETYKKCIELTENPWCCGHFEFNGFQFDKSRVADVKERMAASEFRKYIHVFSGHYHIASDNPESHISYVGSPVQLTWIDCDVEKSVIILDTESGSFRRLVNTNNLYAQYNLPEDGSPLDVKEEDIRGKRVKIHYNINTDKDKINNLQAILKSYGPDQLSFVPYGQQKKNATTVVDISEGLEKSLHEYLELMVFNNPKHKSVIEKLLLSYYNKSNKKE